jgi:hypothetical protein
VADAACSCHSPRWTCGAVCKSWMQLHESPCSVLLWIDGNAVSVFARSREDLLEIYDVVLRLVATSVVHSFVLDKWDSHHDDFGDESISAPSLELLMEHCQSLKSLTLCYLDLDENHCRVLDTYSRPDLEIALIHCKLTSAGTSALVEALGRNQGPTRLDDCDIDYSILADLADGLRGNSRLKSFSPSLSEDFDICKRQVLQIANAVQENKSLVELNLDSVIRCNVNDENDETWGAVCDSFKTHPTLEVLHLHGEDTRLFRESRGNTTLPAPDMIISRIQALLNMLKVNTTIHTIHSDSQYTYHELFQKLVIPYLETNRLRARLLAIQKSRPIAYRAKVLGKELLAARTDANRFWMLFSGNAEVVFLSDTTTIAVAANLPKSANAASTST